MHDTIVHVHHVHVVHVIKLYNNAIKKAVEPHVNFERVIFLLYMYIILKLLILISIAILFNVFTICSDTPHSYWRGMSVLAFCSVIFLAGTKEKALCPWA
jgi:hypothetical protein